MKFWCSLTFSLFKHEYDEATLSIPLVAALGTMNHQSQYLCHDGPSMAFVVRFATLVLLAINATANAKGQRDTATTRQCSIWMAPSSLKGHPGFGVYTTRDLDANESILQSPDSPSILVVDFDEEPVQSQVRQEWIKHFDDYWWGQMSDSSRYEAHGDIVDFQITLGSLPNHHCILANIDHRYPEILYDDSMVDRFRNPGAGAFSYSTGRDFYVNEKVSAGSELFLNYGHCTRDEETLEDWPWTRFTPMTDDYWHAAKIAWEYYAQAPKGFDIRITPEENANEFLAALLPNSTAHFRSIVAQANADDKTVDSPRTLVPLLAKHMTTTPRTPEWIRSNGMCIENLVPRKSTLPQGGKGGFAQYHISKGEIVVPVPMLHIPNKDVLLMYDDRIKDDDENESNTRWQLLLNYCFGHRDSSLLLCPNTNAILINHCSDRKKECGPEGPNAELRWSSGWEPKSDRFRNFTIDEIAQQKGRGLSMEIVALRDIQPGEEVFMDYGQDWEEAWERHVASWKPPLPVDESESFVTAKEANEQDNPLELLVTGNVRTTANHSHLFTGCFYRISRRDKNEMWHKHKDVAWQDMDDDTILQRFAENGSMFRGNFPQDHVDHDYWPCSVISQDSNNTYTVRIDQSKFHPPQPWHTNDLPRILTNYPRGSIHYFVRPYAGDHYLPKAFRHPIGIPDGMFPLQWKNLSPGRID